MNNNTSYGKKFALIFLTACVLVIGLFVIWLMAMVRDRESERVADNIVEQWGGEVYINGPYIKKGENSDQYFYPATMKCEARVNPTRLHRGIYEAEVFTTQINITGLFNFGGFNPDSLARQSKICIGLPQFRVLACDGLKIGDKTYKMESEDYGLYAIVEPADLQGEKSFSIDLKLKGSTSLRIAEVATRSEIIISGTAYNPSFDGDNLPLERSVTEDLFSACWVQDNSMSGESTRGYAKVDFLVGLDRYQKVARSVKYSFLIILLTFGAVLLVEHYSRRAISLFNYFLIGAALVLFYSLLLSLSEITVFGVAYLIASFMTILLVAIYMWKMMRSRKVGVLVGGILSLLYGVCYVMLSAATYALLIGNAILFAALAIAMYASLHRGSLRETQAIEP